MTVRLLAGKMTQNMLQSNKFLRKAFIIFCGITLAVLFFLARRTAFINIRNRSNLRTHSPRLDAAKQSKLFNSLPNKRGSSKKIFIAFYYWEQLARATQNFLDLTALAAYAGRQVVVPFVKDSHFYGSPTKATLAMYYNVTALNRTLQMRGHGTLISWEEFQDVCQGKLDLLVDIDYTDPSQATQADSTCKYRHRNTFKGFKVERTICMNVSAVDSVEKFENEIVKGLPCVGLKEWRGSVKSNSERRAQFNLSSVVIDRMRSRDSSVFFNSKLLDVARTFIKEKLAPHFVSVHIRAEWIFKILENSLTSIATVEKCISNLTALVQKRHRNTNLVFLAADFADYGSRSQRVRPVREISKSLMKTLAPLKPVLFQPSAYNLTDRGAVAIVEMNILASGEHLFVVGGGCFQEMVVNQFLNNKNSTDQKSNDQEASPQKPNLEKICQYA